MARDKDADWKGWKWPWQVPAPSHPPHPHHPPFPHPHPHPHAATRLILTFDVLDVFVRTTRHGQSETEEVEIMAATVTLQPGQSTIARIAPNGDGVVTSVSYAAVTSSGTGTLALLPAADGLSCGVSAPAGSGGYLVSFTASGVNSNGAPITETGEVTVSALPPPPAATALNLSFDTPV